VDTHPLDFGYPFEFPVAVGTVHNGVTDRRDVVIVGGNNDNPHEVAIVVLSNNGDWELLQKTWIGPASGGNWSTTANWSPSGVPGDGDAVIISGSGVSVSGNATVGSLTLAGGASLTLSVSGDHVLRTKALGIGGNSSLDLNDNALIIDYPGGSPVAVIRDYLLSGRNGGAWNGAGISSSAAAALPGSGLGYAEATDLFSAFPASFAGQSVDSTSILVRHTLLGDATLDGNVDVADLGKLATNWQQTQRRWSQGDFNYDGTVDVADLGLLASNWQQGLPLSLKPQPELSRTTRPRTTDRIAHELI
jgi:hypothetical protein